MQWKQWVTFILSSIFIIIQFKSSNDKNSTLYRKTNENISLRDPIQADRIMYDYYVVYRTKIFYLHDDDDD